METKLNSSEVATKYLNTILQSKKLSHAYMFSGNNNVEIDEFVLNFVKAVVCKNNIEGSFHCCNNCKFCKQVDNNNYVDFYTVSTEGTIKKEDISSLRQELTIKPSYGKKIYWLKDVDKLTGQAANSLLKTLEEPEDNIIAILSTTNLSVVLDTIISRCQIIRLGSEAQLQLETLENYNFIENILKNYMSGYNKNIVVLNTIEELNTKDAVMLFFKILLEKIKYSSFSTSNNLENVAIVYNNILGALKDLEMNVAATLVLESFVFDILKNKRELDFVNM